MTRRWRTKSWLSLAVIALLFAVGGCGSDAAKSKAKQTTPNKKAKSASSSDYVPLPYAITKEIGLPFLMGPDGREDISCFEPIEDLKEDKTDVIAKDLIDQHSKQLTDTLGNWIIDDLSPMGLDDTITSQWSVKVEDVVVLKASTSDLKFVPDQACIDESGRMAQETEAAVALYGAKVFNFSSAIPLDFELQEELQRAIGMENMSIDSEAYFNYEPAVDGVGNEVKNARDEVMFIGPGGERIPESEVPDPESRTMTEWVIKSETPIYFAYRPIPKDAMRKESKKDLCDVFLVWGDETPRAPECAEFQESQFVATKIDEDNISLNIKTGGEEIEEQFSFGEVRMIQVSNRILLWLSPKEVEEGCKIRLNSLVLNPSALAEKAPEAFAEREAPLPKSTQPDKKPAKKSKSSSGSSLDDYLKR